MFVSAADMYAMEEQAFARGLSAESLMDQAGQKIAQTILRHFRRPCLTVAVIGKGNNGADAMVALRHLREAGWPVAVRSAISPDDLSGLPLKKWRELGAVDLLSSLEELPSLGLIILLDGLLGIGTSGNLRSPLVELAKEMNTLRQSGRAQVVAIDVPSGLDCDDGSHGTDAVIADLTITLGSPKRGLVAEAATAQVGRLSLQTLPGLSDWPDHKDHLITPQTLPVQKLTRPFDFHKGQAGRVGLIAGSRGLIGAAALCSLGALRGGAGLITLFVHEPDYELVLPLVPVEVMVRPIASYREILDERLDALAVGPGLGSPSAELLEVLAEITAPTIIDADALNLVSRTHGLSWFRPHHLVTPHPGEMARLLPDLPPKLSRAKIAQEFTHRSAATLLFKGARTIVTAPSAPLAYNTTGTPAMASGGQGDVLSGLLAALLARGFSGIEAAKMGAWLAGRASEIALRDHSVESLSASSTAKHLGHAFNELRATS